MPTDLSLTTPEVLPRWPRWERRSGRGPTPSTPLETPPPPSERDSPSDPPPSCPLPSSVPTSPGPTLTLPAPPSWTRRSSQDSLAEMGPPGALVILTPLIMGTLFGVSCLAGVLVGALISGVQLAISASNTGGAWDNAKKYLEAGRTEHARMLGGKGTEAHKAAVIGDTVGDPLKDTSGPSLNILIKLMAVESLVFAPFFATHTREGLIFQLFG